MKKITRIFSILLIAAMLLGLLALTASAAEGYSGTPVTPTKINSDNYRSYGFTADNWQDYNGYYAITNAEELYGFADIVNQKNQSGTGACAVLVNDIIVNTGTVTAAGSSSGTTYDWTPIAKNYNNDYNYYKGTFDGRGHTISGLYVGDTTVKPVGLFGALGQKGAEATVKNVIIANSYFTGNGCVGAIAGHVQGATILNCKVASDVTMSCNSSVGGIAGMVAWACNINITNCINLGKVVGSNTNGRDVGAILGSTMSNSGTYVKISDCYYITGNTTANGEAQAGVGNNMSSNDNGTTGVASASATHTCTGMEHPEIPSSCFKKGATAYTDCMICGTIISGTKSEIDYQHFYLDATCTDPATCADCGATTGGVNADNHTAAPTYSANADDAEKHDKNYSCCSIVIPEPHSFDSGNTCICNAQAVASVTIGGTTQYYMDIQDVVTVVKEAAQLPYVKLFADITLTDTLTFKNAPQGMELDFAGNTIYNPNGVAFKWGDHWVTNNGILTLRDSVGGGGVTSGRYSALELDDDAVIHGGTFKASMDDKFTQAAAIDVYEATVYIYGGVFDATDSAVMTIDGTVNIYGGSFECRTGIFDIRNAGVIQVYAAEFPYGIAKESVHSIYAALLSEVLAPDCYLKDAEGNLISTEGDVYAVSGACTVSAGADLKDAVVTVNGTHTYIGAEIKPDITVTIHGRVIDPANYTITYSNNINVGTATVTVTGKGVYSGENAAQFTITKGSLKVVTKPETTYKFGAAVGDVVSGGKVVIEGNESAVITGTWAWVEQGQTAVFTPDAQYIDLFNELTNVAVTHVVTPATPIIEVVTPSPSIMPGMAIRMNVVVKNPHNGELTDLPTAFCVTYQIGENGTPVTVDGLEFTLPTTGVVLGDKVYVTVKNVAVDGKYAVAVSTNTIELAVGQVDYTASINNLQEAIEELNKAIAQGDAANADALKQAVETLEKALADAVAALEKTDADNKAALETLINEAKTTLETAMAALEERVAQNETNITALQAALTKAIEELNAAIAASDAANADALKQAVETLEKALADAVAALEKTDADNKAALETLINEAKTTLETAIAALEERVAQNETNITALQAALTKAIEELNAAIKAGDEANAQALAGAVETLEKALADAVAALEKADTDNKAALETLINEAKTTLETAIAALEERVAQNETNITALQAALTKAIEELNAAIAAGDAANADALKQAVETLENALADAVAALEKTDADNKAALETLINEAKAAMQAAVDKVAQDLAAAEKALTDAMNAGDEALDQKIEDVNVALNNAIAAYRAADAALRSELASQISSVNAMLQSMINQVAKDLAAAEKALTEAIAAGDAALNEKIEALNAALENAIAAYQAADEAMKTELTAVIEESNATLQAAIDKVVEDLAKAREELTKAMEKGDLVLEVRISSLGTALSDAIAAYRAADKTMSAELDEAVSVLEESIRQVQKDLQDAKIALAAKDSELEAKDAALAGELDRLNTVIILVAVVAGLGVCGCAALLIWIIVDKSKVR